MFRECTSVGLDVHARSVVAAAIDGETGELVQRRCRRRIAEGKTPRDVRPLLKRCIARQIYRHLNSITAPTQQVEGIKVRGSEGGVGHLEVFLIGSVLTPIIERPRLYPLIATPTAPTPSSAKSRFEPIRTFFDANQL